MVINGEPMVINGESTVINGGEWWLMVVNGTVCIIVSFHDVSVVVQGGDANGISGWIDGISWCLNDDFMVDFVDFVDLQDWIMVRCW